MERRKILLGSGAALATVLAGCSSTETDEETTDDGADDDGFDDTGSDDTGSDDDDDDDEEVAGVEDPTSVSSEHLTVVDVENNPDTLRVLVETDTTDTAKLHDEVKYLAEDLSHAVVDPDAFKGEVNSVEFVLEYEGSRVFAVFAQVDWLIEFLDGDITDDELAAKILETKE